MLDFYVRKKEKNKRIVRTWEIGPTRDNSYLFRYTSVLFLRPNDPRRSKRDESGARGTTIESRSRHEINQTNTWTQWWTRRRRRRRRRRRAREEHDEKSEGTRASGTRWDACMALAGGEMPRTKMGEETENVWHFGKMRRTYAVYFGGQWKRGKRK